MKKRFSSLLIVLLILSVLMAAGCGVAQATFEASVTSGAALLKVDFTNKTKASMFKKVDEFRWDFGDGATMTTIKAEDPVSHSYTKAGTFEVTLTAVKGKDASSTSVMTLSISVTHGPLDHVNIAPASVELDIAASQQYTAVVEDAYGNPIAEAKLTWSTTAGSVTQEGDFTAGTQAGEYNTGVVVTAGFDNKTTDGSASVTVKPGPLDSVVILPVSVTAGETNRIEAVAKDKYGNNLNDVETTWTIIDESIGSIVSGTSLKAGETAGKYTGAINVQVTQGSITRTATADATITAGALDKMYIAPDPADIGISMTQQFAAAGADEYGNRITGLQITWEVTNGGGTINSSGLFTAGTAPGYFADTVQAEASVSGVTRTVTTDVEVEQDRIAYMSNQANELLEFDVYTIDIDGRNTKKISPSHVAFYTPSFSPDGRLAVYTNEFPTAGISVMDDDGKWDTTLTPGQTAYAPAWSPDGEKIACCIDGVVLGGYSQSEIYVMDVDGGNLTKLTDNIFDDTSPNWSPDGTKIIFISNRNPNWSSDDTYNEIYIMDADGSDLRRLTNNTVEEYFPKWSPDGQKILYQSYVNGISTIFTINLDGTQSTQITNFDYSCHCPSWSPDGTKIAFHSWQDEDQSEIVIVNSDGSNLVRVTNNQAWDIEPVFIPRKAGIPVSESSINIPFTGNLVTLTSQQILASAGDAIVRVKTNSSTGSGFIISADGLILTDNELVKSGQTIKVLLKSGVEYTASVKARDLVRGIALLKITATGLPYLELADTGISRNQDIFTMGYAEFATTSSINGGLISNYSVDNGRNLVWIQLDALPNTGMSGGPLLDQQGRVIGIITLNLSGNDFNGKGFAVFINSVNTFLPTLKSGVTVSK